MGNLDQASEFDRLRGFGGIATTSTFALNHRHESLNEPDMELFGELLFNRSKVSVVSFSLTDPLNTDSDWTETCRRTSLPFAHRTN
jgi:hypothetical protein